MFNEESIKGSPRLRLLTTGNPSRVLFVHGANCRADVWRPLMGALAEIGIESAAVDLRGHGLSEGHEDLQKWSIGDYVDDVSRTLEELPQPVVLVGHSMGGLVVQRAALKKKLAGLVLLASSPVNGMQYDGFRMFIRYPLTFLQAMRRRSFARSHPINSRTERRSRLGRDSRPAARRRRSRSHGPSATI